MKISSVAKPLDNLLIIIFFIFFKHENLLKPLVFEFFPKYMGKMVGAGAGAGPRAKIFDKLEPEPHKN
jgi:hypothetical protein